MQQAARRASPPSRGYHCRVPEPLLSQPSPEDAHAWFEFLVAEQAATYAGVVPADFAERQRVYRDEWVPGLAERFAEPGHSRAVVAKVEGRIVGIASSNEAPQPWEEAHGLLPAPAARQLERLYVAAEYQGTGLADALLSAVDDGGPVYLWLIDANVRAQRFYARRGFHDLDESFDASPSWGGVAMHRMLRPAQH